MSQDNKSFRDVIADVKTSGHPADLVLGNGFSRGLFGEEFNYELPQKK